MKVLKEGRYQFLVIAVLFVFFFLFPLSGFTAETAPIPSTPANLSQALSQTPFDAEGSVSILTQFVALVLIALSPFIIMLLTSYLKMVVVMSLLRNALGIQQSPPNQVLNGVALMLTVYVMFPTGMAIYNRIEPLLSHNLPKEIISEQTAGLIVLIANEAKEPIRDFLLKNSSTNNQIKFYQLAKRVMPKNTVIEKHDFIIIVPAFLTTQLQEAFEIGVMIYFPFFVIDLVVSNILLAMGMMMLSPLTIALPLKLLLLVMLDGWALLLEGLVLTFR